MRPECNDTRQGAAGGSSGDSACWSSDKLLGVLMLVAGERVGDAASGVACTCVSTEVSPGGSSRGCSARDFDEALACVVFQLLM